MSRRARIVAAVLTIGALPGNAFAWEHLGYAWNCEEPIPWALAMDEQGLAERFEEASIATFEAWEADLDCLCYDFEYMGILDESEGGYQNNGVMTISFGDPDGMLGEGVLFAGMPYLTTDGGIEIDGHSYDRVVDFDLVFNEGVEVDFDYITMNELSEDCTFSFVFENVLGHEIGHALGLADSCWEFSSCEDEAEREAAMYSATLSPCVTTAAEPQQDDIEGLLALYGQMATIESVEGEGLVHGDFASLGVVPVEVCFQAGSDYELDGYSWDFGDGASAEGQEVCHVYEQPDVLEAQVWAMPLIDDCPSDSRRLILCDDYVDLPPPYFELTVLDGIVNVVNLLPRVDTGCTDHVQWDLLHGGISVASSSTWVPSFELPGRGGYSLRLSVGGVSGEITEEQSFQADGCSCAGAPAQARWTTTLLAAVLAWCCGVRRLQRRRRGR